MCVCMYACIYIHTYIYMGDLGDDLVGGVDVAQPHAPRHLDQRRAGHVLLHVNIHIYIYI